MREEEMIKSLKCGQHFAVQLSHSFSYCSSSPMIIYVSRNTGQNRNFYTQYKC